ncbi:hypothetical protein A2331_04920 [Candidatus Falkowbacteria bacterium RIFOXYB2_FULL_34_18]|uniref:histidine kinase n=1 Tax=Candidatus Falkowbacteria bacterium RIFOXYD2_FULL_34_120 TaxID=1798007 RepID=A0A1F5TN78_9BACT|nr:MAG: hypothetical protein A2500_07330 [Candidatus Falkowbacteria bacterium RIFOXYC12_FULL_34_55]OGF28691.1 MAG: hypothetical protein A2331_04920 [Candidatus Falkowbacteria bacterium RIFOXYB2_FULL_34_18]OGF38056.1 MAG: hypothetical protein A2466_04100 [Candidatus Falkowbacteria bacterium RIFOXYC2_FULL_34_220]OGF38310.1 MAG: hypothetical protein A2515_06130 [Candidatus Falkowbacteria bacterium RIFOXYD12_FULL_34_57]OGF40297.1 MAG: hypothetical protein A2531_00390 [Candidatus Falkowbacteria bact
MTLEEKTKSNRENITSGVLIFDEEQNVLMSSFGMSNITGIRQEKINIKSLIKFFKDYSEELKMGIKDAIFNNKNTSIKDVMLNNFVFEICISPLVDKDKNFSGGVVIIHDTTCLKEAEKIKREFVSVASHQIRTPLTGVKLFTDMLLREDVGTINEAQKTYLENVYHGVKTIVNLTDNLMNLFKLEYKDANINLKLLSVNSSIQNVLKELEPFAKTKEIQIIFNSSKKDYLVFFDRLLMQQAFFNIVLNAIQYSPAISGKVEISLEKKKDECVITVKDNGIGIAKKDQKRIFDKFFRAENALKTETEGSGLGLYVSKMIIEKFGGRLWFESRAGGGAIFYVSFPLGYKKN